MTVDLSSAPYTPWLESVVKELYDIQPTSVMMVMRDESGKTFSCYWNVSADDRAIMIDALRYEGISEWIRDNRDEIKAILDGEEDEDGLSETDTEASGEG
ncbi:MAG: hypothetical protein J6R54_02160 [Bacteroidaceae bacterium]|nr:hypothetical protein [Bacteroidaceae bacterium]